MIEDNSNIEPSLLLRGIKNKWDWQPEHYEYVMRVIAKGLKATDISEREKQGWVKCFLATVAQNIEDERHRRDGVEQGRARVLELLQRIPAVENTPISEPDRDSAIANILSINEQAKQL